MADKNKDDDDKKDVGGKAAELFFKSRNVIITGEINDKLASRVTTQLIALAEDSDKPINLFISSPGGHVESGDMVHDMIKFIKPTVRTIGSGWVASRVKDTPDLPATFKLMTGFFLAPVAWAIGVPWGEAMTAGGLLGTKIILNEFIAYLDLAALPAGELAPRSQLIMTYALCGFANFGSLGIMIGGLGTMVPERRAEIVALGMKSIVAGTLATCMTGAVVGVLTPIG